MQHDVEFTNNLHVIRARFVSRIAEWLPAIETLRADLGAGMSASDELSGLKMKAHKIAGSAGTFGYTDLSLLAEALEVRLEQAMRSCSPQTLSNPLFSAIDDFVHVARKIADTPIGDAPCLVNLTGRPDALETVLANSAATHPRLDTHPQRPPHIMIVDDDDLIRSLLVEGLAPHGYTFTQAVNGKEAIWKLFQKSGAPRAECPDLILMDVDMPELDGFEALRLINSSPIWQSTPVMMLTARDEDVSLIRGISGGAQEYMTKPFELGALSIRITDILAANAKRIKTTGGEAKTY